MLKSTDTPKPYYSQEWLLETLKQHQSLETLLDSMEQNFEEALISYSVDSHARISVLQEMEQDWMESEADFSSRSSGSLKKFSQYSSSLKMYLQSGQEDLMLYSKNLPRSGMIVDGQLSVPPQLELHTGAKDGSYLPTPTTQDIAGRENFTMKNGRRLCKNGKTHSISLATMAQINHWPTPRASDSNGAAWRTNQAKGENLPRAVQLYPTPCARDWKDNGKSPSSFTRNSQTLATRTGGKLNPVWVEWLMGYPIDHTELNALVTPLFHFKSKRRLKC